MKVCLCILVNGFPESVHLMKPWIRAWYNINKTSRYNNHSSYLSHSNFPRIERILPCFASSIIVHSGVCTDVFTSRGDTVSLPEPQVDLQGIQFQTQQLATAVKTSPWMKHATVAWILTGDVSRMRVQAYNIYQWESELFQKVCLWLERRDREIHRRNNPSESRELHDRCHYEDYFGLREHPHLCELHEQCDLHWGLREFRGPHEDCVVVAWSDGNGDSDLRNLQQGPTHLLLWGPSLDAREDWSSEESNWFEHRSGAEAQPQQR